MRQTVPVQWTRRKFLTVAGAGALGAAGASALGVALSGPGTATPAADMEDRFRSRPDLDPPEVHVAQARAPLGPGYVLVTPAGPLVLDDAGSPVWTHPVDEASANLQVQRYRGAPVLTWWQGVITHHGIGRGHGVVMGNRYQKIARITAGRGLDTDLHELVLTSRGTAYVTAAAIGHADLRSVGGPRHGRVVESAVQEIDVATGRIVFEWRSSEHIALDEAYTTYAKGDLFDPYHLNSIEELPDGNLLLSARNTWALYKVHKASGAILWRLGGKRSDFHLEPNARFAWQHDARVRPGGVISLFDDESWPKEEPQSRALFLAVDDATGRVSVAHQYTHGHEPLSAGSQGSVQVLDNGDVFVGWGARPYFSQFRADGTLIYDGHILKGDSYRAFRSPWTGKPSEPPAVAVERRGLATFSVFASWNGSTETAAWRVRGGTDPSAPRTLTTAPRQGFETEIGPIGHERYVVVDALSRTGEILGTSAPAPSP